MAADEQCVATLEVCKDADESKPYGFRWTARFARRWEPDAPFAAGDRVRPKLSPRRATGFEYISSGGQSNGGKEPKWPTVDAGEVIDGSLTWTATTPLTYASLIEHIDSVEWDAPSGITVTPRTHIDVPGLQQTLADISGGTSGSVYEIRCKVTTDIGNVYVGLIIMTIN